MSVAGYADLFAAGLGFDLAGAYLLAKGLLTGAEEVAQRIVTSRNTTAGQNVRAAEDRADGRAGMLALGFGFFLQAVGYVLEIGGASSNTGGAGAHLVAATCVAVGSASAIGFAKITRWPWTRGFLVELARHDRWGARHHEPDGRELHDYGEVLQRLNPADHGDLEGHARRIWGVDRIRRSDLPPTEPDPQPEEIAPDPQPEEIAPAEPDARHDKIARVDPGAQAKASGPEEPDAQAAGEASPSDDDTP